MTKKTIPMRTFNVSDMQIEIGGTILGGFTEESLVMFKPNLDPRFVKIRELALEFARSELIAGALTFDNVILDPSRSWKRSTSDFFTHQIVVGTFGLNKFEFRFSDAKWGRVISEVLIAMAHEIGHRIFYITSRGILQGEPPQHQYAQEIEVWGIAKETVIPWLESELPWRCDPDQFQQLRKDALTTYERARWNDEK